MLCKLVTIFFSTLLFTCVSAQEYFYIRMVDSISNHPITSVYFHSKQNVQKMTDENGILVIPCDTHASENINISHPDYKTVALKIGIHCGDTQLIQLKPIHYALDEIVVTGTRTERQLKEVAVHTQIISNETILKSGTTNIAEAISQALPGLEFYNEGRGMTFRLQGIAAKYTLFLIDGERMAGENRDNTDYYRLNASSIHKIEIVKGASSSLYGSSAMGGVVNMITPIPDKGFESKIYTRLSKFNELETGANIGIRQGKIASFTDVVRKSTTGYDLSPETPDLYTVEPYTIFSVYQKVMYDISPKLNITAKGSYYSRERFDVSAIPIHPYYNDINGGISSTYKPSGTTNYTLSWHSDKYNTFSILERRENEKRRVYSDLQHTGRILREQKIISENFIKQQQIIGGIEFFSEKMFAERITDSIKSISNFTLLLQDEIKINESFAMIVGSRLDHHSMYGPHLSPKGSMMMKHHKFIHRVSYGHGFKAPSIKERYYDLDLGFIIVKGNESLRPEKSHYFSFSSEYRHSTFIPSVNIYLNKVSDMIHDIAIANSLNEYTYANFSKVDVRGMDYTQQIKIGNHFIFNAGYSLTDAYDIINKKALTGVSRHSGVAGIEMFSNYKKQRSSIAIHGKMYSSKVYTALDENTYIFYDDNYPAYSIWKMSYHHSFKNNAVSMILGINNLFNTTNPSDLINIDPGRRFYMSLVLSPEKILNNSK